MTLLSCESAIPLPVYSLDKDPSSGMFLAALLEVAKEKQSRK
jgi:hypothetical protein